MRSKALSMPLLLLALVACVAGASRDEPRAKSAAPRTPISEEEPAAESEEDSRTVTDVPGRVVRVMDDRWALQPENDEGTRYAPDELPEEFRIDGLAVVFSGEIGEIPPNVRMYGTPLRLTDIRRRAD